MQSLNNLDIVILIVVGISALIALSRGLIKEVLSIIGWVLATFCVIYLLPLVTPFAEQHIDSAGFAAVISATLIMIVFFIIWILLTGKLIGKVRKSKLSGLDRVLGLFFGIARAFLLVVLCYILINWMVPKENQADVLTKSKYFNIAGSFAKPIEELIPEQTLAKIREKTKAVSGKIEDDDEDEDNKPKTDIDVLFEMLAQPKVAKKKEPILVINNEKANEVLEKKRAAEKAAAQKTNAQSFEAQKSRKLRIDIEKSYNLHERTNLDRLIENTVD